MPIISLITDFGYRGWFVGEMKAAILSISPSTTIVDITHDVPPGDIRYAAFTLKACFKTFPEGTIFCVVIDPEVGGNRKALVIKTEKYFFVGPDNGVLSWASSGEEKNIKIRVIQNEELFLRKEISSTFHGRDIFAPVAAHLASGEKIEKVGDETESYIKYPEPYFTIEDRAILTEVIFVDSFGNLITSVKNDTLPEGIKKIFLYVKDRKFTLQLENFFAAVEKGKPLIYQGSAGYMEIGINRGNAAEYFNLKCGDLIKFTF